MAAILEIILEKVSYSSQTPRGMENFTEITLSRTVKKIQKLKMAATLENFWKSCHIRLYNTLGVENFRRNSSISHS